MKESEFIRRIVQEANNITNKNFEIYSKDGEYDLVTNLDLEIEKYLIGEIKREYPDFDIVSEEFNMHNEVTDNCFIIDPIDGTINFANNLPLWGIQIACRKEGKTIASVISLPRINEFYYADETGAYLNGEKIRVNEVNIKNALYAIDGNNNLPCMQRMRKYSSNRRNFGGVCVSMAFLASGRIHGAVFRSDKPWDYEPGLFLCKMAGASVLSIKGFHGAAMNQEFLDILKTETAKKVDSSNIFVLHSLNGDTLKMWGLDVKENFGAKEIDVFLPEFPIRAESSYEEFNKRLMVYLGNGKLNANSIVICHSISNSYFIRFCFEHGFVPKNYIAVAPRCVYPSTTDRTDYFASVSKKAVVDLACLEYVKDNFKDVYCLYSDEEIGNMDEFSRFIQDTNAHEMHLDYYDHFDGYHRIYKISELNDLIDNLL